MPENGHPLDGQVWRSPSGRPMLYVRTEETPGRDAPRHLFVSSRERMVWTTWHPDGAMPEEYELVSDGHAVQRATADREALVKARILHGLEVAELRANVAALTAAMKRAVAVVSPIAANDLRRVYREALGEALSQ